MEKCRKLVENPHTSFRDFMLYSCSVTYCLHEMRYLQRQHIYAMKGSQNPQTLVCFNQDSIQELEWWEMNLNSQMARLFQM